MHRTRARLQLDAGARLGRSFVGGVCTAENDGCIALAGRWGQAEAFYCVAGRVQCVGAAWQETLAAGDFLLVLEGLAGDEDQQSRPEYCCPAGAR